MRRGLQIGLLVSGVIVCALAGYWLWWALDGGPDRSRPSVGGPFELIDGDGRKVTERDFEGRHMLVYFGYTFCPDVCPTTLFNASGALDGIGPALASKVRLVFISIDPERDTPDIVKEYAAHFHPGTVGLTGTPEQVADLIEDWFHDGAADGFNVMPPLFPTMLDVFAEEVIPVLQRRGLFRTEYKGKTLREHYGLDRPAGRFW